MPHYMMDSFFRDAQAFDGFKRDTFVVKVSGRLQAIEEAKRIAALQKPAHFKVRYITTANDRRGGDCIYDSREQT